MRDLLFILRSKYKHKLLPWLFQFAPRWYRVKWHKKNSPCTMALLRMDPTYVESVEWDHPFRPSSEVDVSKYYHTEVRNGQVCFRPNSVIRLAGVKLIKTSDPNVWDIEW